MFFFPAHFMYQMWIWVYKVYLNSRQVAGGKQMIWDSDECSGEDETKLWEPDWGRNTSAKVFMRNASQINGSLYNDKSQEKLW